MRVLIAGDSHCNGYAEAASSRGSTSIEFEFRFVGPSQNFLTPFHDEFENHLSFRHHVFYLEEFARRLPQIPLATHGRPFDWYGFSGPFGVMDIFVDEHLFIDERAAISKSLLRQIVADRSQPWLEFLQAAQRLKLPVFVLEPPAPFASSLLVRRMQRHAGADTLIALEHFARTAVRNALRASAIPIVELPKRALAPTGYMAEEFRHPNPSDPHHGNSAFSAMMLRRTARLLSGLGPGGTPLGLLSRLPGALEADGDDHNVDLAYFRCRDGPGEMWIFQPGAFAPSNLTGSPRINVAPASSLGEFLGMRIGHRPGGAGLADEDNGINTTLPENVRAAISGRRIALSVLARSARADRDTRFAIALSAPGIWTSGWCWFHASPEPSGQRFHFHLPQIDGAEPLLLGFKPNEGSAEALAPAEIFAVAIAVVAEAEQHMAPAGTQAPAI